MIELNKEATDKFSVGSTVLPDDITALRRIKKHVASCDHCREALSKEDNEEGNEGLGPEPPRPQPQNTWTQTTQPAIPKPTKRKEV